MNESIYKYADVGLIHFMAYPQTIKGEGPILETLAAICDDDYFTLVEVTWMKDPEPADRARGMELLAESVKEICDYAKSRGNLPIALETFDQVEYGKNTIL